MGRLGAFQGDLNPLSSCSIFEASIVPTLLYGCETWLLDTSCLKELEAFQHEIGCRILRVPKFYSAVAIRVALHWPSISTLILLRKLNYLGKLLASEKDTISCRMLNSVAMENVYDCSIVQQCRMLEVQLGTTVLGDCLSNPTDAIQIVKDNKELILKTDFSKLLYSNS